MALVWLPTIRGQIPNAPGSDVEISSLLIDTTNVYFFKGQADSKASFRFIRDLNQVVHLNVQWDDLQDFIRTHVVVYS